MEQWKCPGLDIRVMPQSVYEKALTILESESELNEAIEQWRNMNQSDEITLPFVQNLEASVLGCGIKKMKNYWTVGPYCHETLEELQSNTFEILSDSKIETMLSWLGEHTGQKVIVEVEAPFSILAALINPMTLYESMMTEPELLEEILLKLTRMQEQYIQALIKAGCHVISLADPAGTIELIGKEMYCRFSGKAMCQLIQSCEPFLTGGIIHLCGKMSYSMAAAGLADITSIKINEDTDYHSFLFRIAENTEMRCIGHNCMNHTKKVQEIYQINLAAKC